MKWPGTYLVVAVLLASAFTASSQERVWDAALDRYEYVCSRCIEWKNRIAEGKTVPRDSLVAMMKELEQVKRNLQYVLGDMTPRQRHRFEASRDYFNTGKWPAGLIEPMQEGFLPGVQLSSAAAAISPRPEYYYHPVYKTRWWVRHCPFAGITAGVYPDFSIGLLGGISVGICTLFLKGRSNFQMQKTEYECLSNGTTEEGYFWSGNGETVNRHQLALDIAFGFWYPVSLYIGAGYGVRTLCWKDSRGQWAKVTDRSWKGFAPEAGMLIRPIRKGYANGLNILVGVSWIPKEYFDAEAGLAWQF